MSAARKWYVRDRTWAHRQWTAMASFTLLLTFALLLLFPHSLSGAWTRLLSSRLATLRMAFFPLPTSLPVAFVLPPSSARALYQGARVCLRRLLLCPYLVRHLRHLGRIPFPLILSPFPRFLHFLLINLLSLLLFLLLILSSPHCPHFSRPFTLFFFTFVKSHSNSVLCHILFACHFVSLCRSLIFLPPSSRLFSSTTGECT